MNETILKALMRLFAIVASVDSDGLSPKARKVVLDYLEKQLNQELASKYIEIFDYYLKVHHPKTKDKIKSRKRMSLNSVKVLAICNEINEELQQREKVIVLLRLLEFITQDTISEDEFDFIQTVSDVFNIPRTEFNDLYNFVLGEIQKIKNKDHLLIIDAEKKHEDTDYHHITEDFLFGYIQMFYLQSTNLIIFQYRGKTQLNLNNFNVECCQTYIFDIGSVIKGQRIKPIYYTEILSVFRKFGEDEKIYLLADNISYTFPNSNNGIKPFTLAEESGHLVGIMGGSGVGKSTFLNILIGNIKADTGRIYINGYDLYEDSNKLEGIIGYVPQDDLLIEELTVFENLYFNAQLCFRNYSKFKIIRLVLKILKELDLLEIKDLKVGTPLNKFISGGQRKRLNIALELIREPSILFADEPTSGLSSSDSEVVMSLLKELTYKGKLVFVNIHQPASDIFKLFDKIIIIDKGGYPVFYGNPIDAVVYFRQMNNIANAEDAICPTCGNVNPDQILELIENKVVNEYGKFTEKRKIEPEKWYQFYMEYRKDYPIDTEEYKKKKALPKILFEKANSWQQFKVFTFRNLKRKIADKQYVLINFLEAPILAFILGFFSKFFKGTAENPDLYIFYDNVNIPSFLFMAVTVALFIGLTVSAEEIIKDRKILRREKFLSLSNWSYINSKVVILLFISAIQTLLFVIVGNLILEIHGLTIKFWLILFATSLWANLTGLIISSALKSVVTIYITIPLILIPLILFSGTVIDFTKLNKAIANQKYTPLIGDIMVSRWALEALMVTQYTDNLYEKNFFEYDMKKENATYLYSTYYDKLTELLNYVLNHKKNEKDRDVVLRRFTILQNELKKVAQITGIECPDLDKVNIEKFNAKANQEITTYLYNFLKMPNNKIAYNARTERDQVYYKLVKKLGSEDAVLKLKNDNLNKKVEEFVTNSMSLEDKIIETKTELVRRYKPIFAVSDNRFGRSHFYAAYKRFGNFIIKTLWFNIAVILIFTLILYIVLITGIADHERLKKFNKR